MVIKRKNIPKPTNFGANLKFLRRLHGVSQSDFAAVIGISRNSVASYENGIVEPNSSNFLKVCDYFKVDPLQMMIEDMGERHTNQDAPSADDLKKYVFDSFKDFLAETNEVTKVFEGYTAFYEMRRETEVGGNSKELMHILDDLFLLLQTLIKENWNLIQDIYPHYDIDQGGQEV